jgi:hypothetical protein
MTYPRNIHYVVLIDFGNEHSIEQLDDVNEFEFGNVWLSDQSRHDATRCQPILSLLMQHAEHTHTHTHTHTHMLAFTFTFALALTHTI